MDGLIERWKTIKDHENYEVSTYGRVRRKKDYKILSQSSNRQDGYLRVALDRKKYCVHRLVADTFYDRDGTRAVTHMDGNKRNNILPNLYTKIPSKGATNDDKKGATNDDFCPLLF